MFFIIFCDFNEISINVIDEGSWSLRGIQLWNIVYCVRVFAVVWQIYSARIWIVWWEDLLGLLLLLLVLEIQGSLSYWRRRANTQLLGQFVWRPLHWVQSTQVLSIRERGWILLILAMFLHFGMLLASGREKVFWRSWHWVTHIAVVLHLPILGRSILIILLIYGFHFDVVHLGFLYQFLCWKWYVGFVSAVTYFIILHHQRLRRIYIILFR